MGKAFASVEEAKRVRSRICSRSMEVGLADAVNQFRSMRTKADLVSNVVDPFLEDAPSLGSLRNSGEPYSQRTLDHYRTILRRAQSCFEGMTMRQFMKTDELLRFKGWFKLPKHPMTHSRSPENSPGGSRRTPKCPTASRPSKRLSDTTDRRTPNFRSYGPAIPPRKPSPRRPEWKGAADQASDDGALRQRVRSPSGQGGFRACRTGSAGENLMAAFGAGLVLGKNRRIFFTISTGCKPDPRFESSSPHHI